LQGFLFRLSAKRALATKWEFKRKTKAPPEKVVEYFSHPENLPKVHPDFVKSVTIKSSDPNTIHFEQQMELMKRKIVAQNKMTINRPGNKVVVDTVGGDGKGSKVTMALNPLPGGGTEIDYVAEMELGPLGFFAKGPAKSAMDKVTEEDARNLDAATA
jgi:carbon monoxide dehydrogenase subunit G